jgi:pseudouridine synthase
MEEDIAAGNVKVNGLVVTAMGFIVDPEIDLVEYEGKPVKLEEALRYILLNKPVGTVTTVKDEKNRKTVLELISVRERIYPVGRLDLMTSGLLILTNDGAFAYAMTHPKHQIPKTYLALVKGKVHPDDLMPMERGMTVGDVTYAPAKASVMKVESSTTLLEITISEGRNRQVRIMCEAVGHPVVHLERTTLGPLTLGGLKPGQWRHLTPEEVQTLKEWAI